MGELAASALQNQAVERSAKPAAHLCRWAPGAKS